MRLVIGYWIMDYSENQITHSKTRQVIKLEPRAIEVLCYLAKKSNTVISQNELLKEIWKDRDVSIHAVYRIINQIRKSLVSTDEGSYIATVSKKGYKLIQPVSKFTTDPPAPGIM